MNRGPNATELTGETTTGGELFKSEVLERSSLHSGEPIWQAEITVPHGGQNHAGKIRVFTIRGPPRKTREQAESDAKKLGDAASEGPKQVRALANSMHRP